MLKGSEHDVIQQQGPWMATFWTKTALSALSLLLARMTSWSIRVTSQQIQGHKTITNGTTV
jgi:hypothetical protein